MKIDRVREILKQILTVGILTEDRSFWRYFSCWVVKALIIWRMHRGASLHSEVDSSPTTEKILTGEQEAFGVIFVVGQSIPSFSGGCTGVHPYTQRLPHPRQPRNYDRRTGGQEVLKGVVFKVMAYMCVGLHPGAASSTNE